MVKFLISRPIAVIMVFIAVLMLGLVSYRLLPVALMPDIDIPEITVQASYPNSSAREFENAITSNLRNQLMQVAHLTNITSETSDGRASIRLSFEYGTPVDYSFIEVNEKIDGAMGSLPRDMKRPRVIKALATDLPVFYLNISLNNDTLANSFPGNMDKFIELSDFCENIIVKRIEQLPEVAMVDKSGLLGSEIMIKPDKQKMEGLNISFNQVQDAVNSSNFHPGSIMVRDGYYEYYIRFTSYIKTPADIGNIFIRTQDKILQLKDIAEITVQPQKPRGVFITGNRQAITMGIIQQADARMADLKSELSGMIDRFKNEYPDMNFEISQDQSQLLDFTISNLKQDLMMGAIMAFLLLFLFLNDYRAPVLIGITVPVSLIISLLFFKLFHLSINIISLAGLALGLGMIIDCSIIVIENILYYRQLGNSLPVSCVRGTSEVIRPMLSSTLTTSAVFMPLIFLSGMAGALFFDEAVSVSLGNAASFIVAITLLPVLFKLFYKAIPPSDPPKRRWIKKVLHFLGMNGRIKGFLNKVSIARASEKWYERGIDWVFAHKTLTTAVFLFSLVSIVLLFGIVKKETFPAFQQTELVVNIDWNENIHLNENQSRVKVLLNKLAPFLEQSNSLIGEQQFVLKRKVELDYFQAELYLKLKTPKDVEVVKELSQKYLAQQYPNVKIVFRSPENIFERIFANNNPPLLAKVSVNNAIKPEADSIVMFAARADSLLRTHVPNLIPLKQQLVVTIDQEKALLYGVDYNSVYQIITTAFNENRFAALQSYQRFMPIVLGEDSRVVGDVLVSHMVKNAKGEEFPINTFVSIRHTYDLKYITAGQQGEYIPLSYTIDEEQADSCKVILRQLAGNNSFPDVQFAGSLMDNNKMFGELAVILIISVLLLYFILAAQFESLLQPFIVLLEIPVDIAGALFLLWIFGESLNIMSGIGIIIMCGVIINDSILKVDTINRLRRDGLPLFDAIKQGGKMRLGSILMTAATTIFAVLPFFWGDDMGSTLQQPLSLALIGGMTVGTLVSLFFVPLAYWAVYRNDEK